MKKLLTIAAICMLCTSCYQQIPNLSPDSYNPFIVQRIEALTDSVAIYYDQNDIILFTNTASVILPIGAYQLNDTITIP